MEEQVGQLWHRFITHVADQSNPQAAVCLQDIKHGLAIFFRAMGGDGGLQIETAEPSSINVRRNVLQRVAGVGKKVVLPWRDGNSLRLPSQISLFETVQLNHDLYFWLAALGTVASYRKQDAWLNNNRRATLNVLERFPGLSRRYERLVEAHLQQRPEITKLPEEEAAAEILIRNVLVNPKKFDIDVSLFERLQYQPYPVPLWLITGASEKLGSSDNQDLEQDFESGKDKERELEDMGKRKAEKVSAPEDDRGLITIRMENILTLGEFVNVDRGNEDEDDLEQAETVARDLDRLSVTRDNKAVTSRLKFDLDLPSNSEDDQVLQEGILLPEWDWKKQQLIADCCNVVELVSRNEKQQELPLHLKRLAKRLRNQFQALVPARTWLPRQADGQEVDLDAYLRFVADSRAGHDLGHDNLYRELKSGARDLSCMLLADLSLSTDSWVDDEHRVIDIIRDSLYLFAESLNATGDRFAMYGFSSRRRNPIRLHRIKEFSEKYDGYIRERIAEIAPGYYTRLGAGIRYATDKLTKQPEGKRLLLILTDGKPNDLDKYEGRFGIEDTHHAILAARRAGLKPFCVTIDRKGNEYLPHLFGVNGFVVIKKPTDLPKKLPLLYANLSV